ncbi:DUF2242 domain-containing protein [Paraburkholderia sp. CNPSo 3157]|uniref:DUF2242 domain-containing protein n=1 Tax=Paraburkholderia franconis TaxID=2654983 RepID=A0A7X1NKL0_9BURK|nr:DUF2242 domain-containing protein [Paraburkholderia franconis]
MHTQFRFFSAAFVLALASALSACSTPKPLYQQEQFDSADSPYMHRFDAKAESTCEAARRALLSQGYIAGSAKSDSVDGSKNFQPNNDSHAVIEIHVVCTADDPKSNHSTAYVNAVQDRYALKKSNTSASVGLSVFGSLSLPIGSSDDSMVKVASETIPAGVFYQRYFALVEHYLKADAVRPANAATDAAAAPHEPHEPHEPQILPSMNDAVPSIGAALTGSDPEKATSDR